MRKRSALPLLLFTPFLWLAAASAEIVQQLDKNQSKLHFSLTSSVMELSGKFNSYSGSLSLDNASLKPSAVTLKVDVSDVNVAPVETMPFLSPEAVFRAMPDPIAVFRSTKIVPLGPKSYRVVGKVRRGAREWDTSFKATLTRISAQSAEVYFTSSGPVLDFAGEIPFRFNGLKDQGSLECRLVFKSGR